MTIEKAMQLIKGGFYYRLKKESGYLGEVSQRGFPEVRMLDEEGFFAVSGVHPKNPVKEGLAAGMWRYCFAYLARQKAAEAKALDSSGYRRHD
jgi:putative transposase